MIKRCGKCYQTLSYEQAWFDEVHICGESAPQKSYIEQKELLMEEGRKFDSEKPKMYLLPPKAIIEVAKVLTFGAAKYDEDNWRYLEDAQNRYSGGALRHIFSHLDGELQDPETNLSHIAHAICCLMFKLELELENHGEIETTSEEERLRGLERSECGEGDPTPEPYYESSKGWVTGDILLSATQTDNEERSVPTFKDCLQYPTSSQNNRGTQ